MNILSVSQYYPPHIGGLEQVAKKMAESLKEAGHTVSIVTFVVPGTQSGSVTENGITVHRVSGWNFFDTHFGIPFPLGGFGLVRRMQKEVQKADAVHLHDVFYQTSWVAYFFARLYGKPVVLTQHVGMVAHTSALVMAIQKAVYGTIGTLIFRNIQKAIVYNKNVYAFLESYGVPKEKILELRNGIDVRAFVPLSPEEKKAKRLSLGLSPEKPLALFVGRFVPKKGYDVVYGARGNAYDIAFVGSGAFPEEWKNTPGIHYLGAKTQEELATLYPLADMFVFPAKGELFTLVMQEAMAAGLPIITTNEPAYQEYDFDRNRMMLVSPTEEGVRTALETLAGDVTLRAEMGKYSRILAEDWFDWNKNIAPILSLYRALEVGKGRKEVLVTTSWDDGHILDIRLADMLSRYGIQGTFYISPRDHEFPPEKLLTDEQVRILSNTFEIGAHTMTHRPLITISRDEVREELKTSKEHLEKVTGKPVITFCYPRGEYRTEHLEDVMHAGFSLARTVTRFSYDHGNNLFELPTSVHAYDHWSDIGGVLRLAKWNPFRFMKLYHRFDLQAIAMFDKVVKEGGIFHLWGHSWEVDNHDDWDRLEAVLKYISNREGVRYVPNGALIPSFHHD